MTNWLIPQVVMEEALKEYTEKERPTKMRDLITKRSWCGDEPTVVKTGDTIQLNWSHEASETLGKVKSIDFHNGRGLTVNLEATAPDREWIKELTKEVNQKIAEKEWRNVLDFSSNATNYITEQDFDQFFLRKHYDEFQWRIRTPEEQAQYELERDSLDAFRYVFENLKLSLRSAQDREIAKYSVKDKFELMTPYDIWEQNKKGELPMNTYDVAYNEKKAAAQKAYDEAMLEAKKEKEEAAQKEANDNAAKVLKGLYDSYVNAGFTPEQAEKFVTIALEKVASKI